MGKRQEVRRRTFVRLSTDQIDTRLVRLDTVSVPVLQRTHRVPAWTMWCSAAASVVLGIVGACAWAELLTRW